MTEYTKNTEDTQRFDAALQNLRETAQELPDPQARLLITEELQAISDAHSSVLERRRRIIESR